MQRQQLLHLIPGQGDAVGQHDACAGSHNDFIVEYDAPANGRAVGADIAVHILSAYQTDFGMQPAYATVCYYNVAIATSTYCYCSHNAIKILKMIPTAKPPHPQKEAVRALRGVSLCHTAHNIQPTMGNKKETMARPAERLGSVTVGG